MSELIVLQARTWIGTKFLHQGRSKRSFNNIGGCDCIGLILGIAQELNIKSKTGLYFNEIDIRNYPLISKNNMLKEMLDCHLHKINTEDMSYGDLILLEFNKIPQHVGIISDYHDLFGIIHSFITARKVVEHHLTKEYRERIISTYKLIV